jgi:type I restriction-modification system DNA methylase subunit
MDTHLKYSELSAKLTKAIPKKEKQANGIYFTPPNTVKRNIELLEPYLNNITTVLEPSCGSGEYITQLKTNNNLEITGVEMNEKIFESIQPLEDTNLRLINSDFLGMDFSESYDLIIGNPPYFVIKKGNVDESYYDYFDGRPNIFILFIIKSLGLLNSDGILSFILPKSFLNCLYYDNTRKYINQNFTILDIVECTDKYIDTQQGTIILIIQNKAPVDKNNRFTIIRSPYTIFSTSEALDKLKQLYENSTTLKNMGFSACIGNITWNQYKDILTSDDSNTLLVYSSDIKKNTLEVQKYRNEKKKNYINKSGKSDPLLVINRGYGNGKYKLNYAIINETGDKEYLVENHLICIKYNSEINKDELIELYKKIIKSFTQDKTGNFIRLYFSNNAINVAELCNILPIYDI